MSTFSRMAGRLQQYVGWLQMLAGHYSGNYRMEAAGVIREVTGRVRAKGLVCRPQRAQAGNLVRLS